MTGDRAKQQTFSIDETALDWKKMPSRTLIARKRSGAGLKDSKDRLTVLSGADADGDLSRSLC